MTLLSNLYDKLAWWRRPQPPVPPGMEERLSWLLRPHLHTLEDLLMWRNTSLSLCFFVFTHIFLWVLRTFNVRLYGLLGVSLLISVALDGIATYLGERKAASASGGSRKGKASTAASSSRPAPQLREAVQRVNASFRYVCGHLAGMRNTNHAQFCTLVCSSITALWILVWLGGGLFWHCVLSLLLLSPLLPALEASIRQSDSDGEVEGFLPELSPQMLRELNAAGDHMPEPQEYSSLISDLSLPPDDAVLRYATGEASSSEDEGDGKGPPTPDPPSTDTTDSDSEFLIHAKNKKSNPKGNQKSGGWFGISSLTPSAPPQSQLESDSDEFEIVDKNDL